jgi:tetratricopeptide (TPR) repeat protein
LLSIDGEMSDTARAHAYNALGWHLFVHGSWTAATSNLEASLALAKKTGDRALEATDLAWLTIVRRWLTPHPPTPTNDPQVAESLAIARSIDDPAVLLNALLCAYATAGGNYPDESPERGLNEAIAIAESLGDEWTLAHAENGLGDYFVTQNRLDEAHAHYRAALIDFVTHNDPWMAAWTHLGLAEVSRLREKRESEEQHLLCALDLFDEVGDRIHTYQCLRLLGVWAATNSNGPLAALCFAASAAMEPNLGPAAAAIRAEVGSAERADIAARLRVEFPREWTRGLSMTAREVRRATEGSSTGEGAFSP